MPYFAAGYSELDTTGEDIYFYKLQTNIQYSLISASSTPSIPPPLRPPSLSARKHIVLYYRLNTQNCIFNVLNKNARCEHNINASLTLTAPPPHSCACVRCCIIYSALDTTDTISHDWCPPCSPSMYPPQQSLSLSLSLALSLYPVGNASRSHIRHSAPHHGRLRAHTSVPGKRTVNLYRGVAAV